MIRIVVQDDVAEQIRRSEGQIELVDDQGNRLGLVRRPPSETEIMLAKKRIGSTGPKSRVEELLVKIEAL